MEIYRFELLILMILPSLIFIGKQEKKWKSEEGTGGKRGFCMFVLDPIYKLFKSIMDFKKDAYEKLFEKLDIKLQVAERDLEGKALLKVGFRLDYAVSSSARVGYRLFHFSHFYVI